LDVHDRKGAGQNGSRPSEARPEPYQKTKSQNLCVGVLDLFGVHPTAPTARFDVMGLIPIVRGRSVCVLTEKSATIDCKSGAKLTFYAPTGAGAVLITESAVP